LTATGQPQIDRAVLNRDELSPSAVCGDARVDGLVEHLHDPLRHRAAEVALGPGSTDRWAGAVRVVDEDPAGFEISLAVEHGATQRIDVRDGDHDRDVVMVLDKVVRLGLREFVEVEVVRVLATRDAGHLKPQREALGLGIAAAEPDRLLAGCFGDVDHRFVLGHVAPHVGRRDRASYGTRVTRILLLLPTSTYRAADFLRAAAEVGAEVVVASERCQTLAPLMGHRALTVPLRRPEKAADRIVALAERAPLDAVVAVDDQGVLVAAQAAARLGLAHNPPEAIAATRDKATLRRRLAAAGIQQPAFRVVVTGDDVAAAAAAVGLPVLVKPVSLSGSRGVIRADDLAGAAEAAARVRRILKDADEDPNGPLLVERFVPGIEVAVEALLRGGRLEVLATFDKPDPLDGPYFEETIYVTPSRLRLGVLQAVHEATAAAAAALGLVEGPVHAELRLNNEGVGEAGASAPDGGPESVWVLELAARSIGGLCARTLRFGAGMSLEQVILRHALGLPFDDLVRESAAAGVMMLPIPHAGVLRTVRGRDEASAVDGIVGLEITIAIGRAVRPLPEGDRYLGFLFARGATPQDVEETLRKASTLLDVVIEET
jgi:biotin carboxylase